VTNGVWKIAWERLKNSKYSPSLEGYQNFNLRKTLAKFLRDINEHDNLPFVNSNYKNSKAVLSYINFP
jgi:hypothetical protein